MAVIDVVAFVFIVLYVEIWYESLTFMNACKPNRTKIQPNEEDLRSSKDPLEEIFMCSNISDIGINTCFQEIHWKICLPKIHWKISLCDPRIHERIKHLAKDIRQRN
jgi:hypothetical protein